MGQHVESNQGLSHVDDRHWCYEMLMIDTGVMNCYATHVQSAQYMEVYFKKCALSPASQALQSKQPGSTV